MNEQNTKHLVEKYPKLYQQVNMPMTQTCMCWGFECGDGWFKLIDELSSKIEAWNNLNPADITVEAVQVKEKFGSLRFYYNGGDNYIDTLVSQAEMESEKTCEDCGKTPAKIESDCGWLSCRCDECRASEKQ